MHKNAELIESFYRGFQERDYKAMWACYHPDVTFSDPVFQNLSAAEARAMWQMFCMGGSDLRLTFRDVQADDKQGSAHWDADYTFSTGRRVHNPIDARFVFRDGLIIRHQDSFDLWSWEAQALGPVGRLLGWAPPMQASVRKRARQRLGEFMSTHLGE